MEKTNPAHLNRKVGATKSSPARPLPRFCLRSAGLSFYAGIFLLPLRSPLSLPVAVGDGVLLLLSPTL